MNEFAWEGLAFISSKQDSEMVGSRVMRRDVLLNITGASIGRVCVVPDSVVPANVNQHVCIIRNDGSWHPQFLAFYLSSPDFQHFILEDQAGATRQALTKGQIENFCVPLPTLSVQEHIAELLARGMEAASAARRAAMDRLAAAEALAAAIYREVFGDAHPFDASPLSPTEPTRPGWRWHRLTDVASLATGHTPSRRCPEYWEGDIPWLQLPDIRALDGQTAQDTSEHTNELGINNSAAVLLPPDTVCLSRTASVGFVTVLGRGMATSQDFVNWNCGPDLDPYFLMHVFISSRRSIRELGSGAVHHTIYFPTIKQFAVCAPAVVEQRTIARSLSQRLAAADSVIRRCREELAAIDSIPAALLRDAFGGPTLEGS